MLSFGSAAYLANKTLIGTFEGKFGDSGRRIRRSETMAWWQTQPAAWQACRENLQSPEMP